jgi:apolipoprotein N-acyltransferase
MTLAWIVLALYGSLYVPILLAVLRRLDQARWPLVLTLPLVLVCMEWVRGNLLGGVVSLLLGHYQHDLPGGFAWYLLGHSQHNVPEMIQIADLFGAYGITFVLAMVNALFIEMLMPAVERDGQRDGRPRLRLLAQGWLVALTVLATLGYGVWQLGRETMQPGPRVALLQGSTSQDLRDRAFFEGGNAAEQQAKMYIELCNRALRTQPDLIVWPETSNPGVWVEHRPGEPNIEARDLTQALLKSYPVPHLLGLNVLEIDDEGVSRFFNSAVFIRPGDRPGDGYQGRYDKVHRVPFGEYIPLGPVLGWLRGVGPNSGHYGIAPGARFTRFALSGRVTFGTLICYEDSVPSIAREYLRGPAPVDFLVNISNDGWWRGTFGHDQHLAVSRFRAVECRRSIVRAVNLGVSAVIDSNGRVLASETEMQGDFAVWRVTEPATALPLSRWPSYRVQPGVLVGRVPLDGRPSLYVWWGDSAVLLCGLLLLGLLLRSPAPVRSPNEREHAGTNSAPA